MPLAEGDGAGPLGFLLLCRHWCVSSGAMTELVGSGRPAASGRAEQSSGV